MQDIGSTERMAFEQEVKDNYFIVLEIYFEMYTCANI